jgi:hypothetical protein
VEDQFQEQGAAVEVLQLRERRHVQAVEALEALEQEQKLIQVHV